MTVEDSSQATELYNTVVAGDGQISSLSKTPGGRFVLSSALIGTLSAYTGFKELRVRCFKPWHGRTAHFIMKGDYLMKALMQSTTTNTGLCGDGEMRFLSDDNSVTRSSGCSRFGCGLNQEEVGLYDHLIWDHEAHKFAYQLRSDRFECDDNINTQAGSTQAGNWQYYVR